MKIPKVAWKRAEAVLDRIYELCNDEGAHWVKKQFRTLAPGSDGKHSFCLVGAGRAALDEEYRDGEGTFDLIKLQCRAEYVLALEVLAEAIDPQMTAKARQLRDRYQDQKYYSDKLTISWYVTELEAIVIRYNDNPRSTWGGVTKKLKKAKRLLATMKETTETA